MKLSFVSKKAVRNIKIIVCAAYIFYFIVCCVSLAENISHPIKIGQPIKIGNLGNEFVFFLLFAVMTMVQTILYHVLKYAPNDKGKSLIATLLQREMIYFVRRNQKTFI